MVESERHAKCIEKLHGYFEVLLKIGKEVERIAHGSGVRQGDNLAPSLYIIVMQLTAEDIIEILKISGVDAPKIICDPNENGVLRSHNREDMSRMVEI